MKRKLLTIILTISMIVTCIPYISFAADLGSNDFGTVNCEWNKKSKTLTVKSGKIYGVVDEYDDSVIADAWYMHNVTSNKYYDSAKVIVIEPTVDSIGEYAFANFSSTLQKVTFNEPASPGKYKITSAYKMFYNCNNISEINGLEYFDMSACTTLESMFENVSTNSKALNNLNVKDWDVSNCTNMLRTFRSCYFNQLDLSGWDTSNVITMNRMFSNCVEVVSITFSDKFDVSNVTDMTYMFYSCKKLTSLDLTDWVTSSLENIFRMFEGCTVLAEIQGIEGLNLSNVKDITAVFYGCNAIPEEEKVNIICNWDTSNVEVFSYLLNGSKLTEIDLTGLETDSALRMDYMFSSAAQAQSIKLGNDFDTSNVTTMAYMFSDCKKLTSIDFGDKWDTSNVTTMAYMFGNDECLVSLDVSQWDTSSLTTVQQMFHHCKALTEITGIENFLGPNVKSISGVFRACTAFEDKGIETILNWDTSGIENMEYLFSYTTCDTLDLTGLETDSVIDMVGMFDHAEFSTINFGDTFDTSKVTNMSNMFSYCPNVVSLDLTSFDTSSVTNMTSMFDMLSFNDKLEALDLTGWDVSKLTTVSSMFRECKNLTEIKGIKEFNTESLVAIGAAFQKLESLGGDEVVDIICSWDTSKVTNMSWLFNNVYTDTIDLTDLETDSCTNMYAFFYQSTVKNIILGDKWDTSKVTNMDSMFMSLPNVEEIDLGNNFNTSNVTTMQKMFDNCPELKTIKGLEQLDTSNVTNMALMFKLCKSITDLDLSNFDTSKVTTFESMFEDMTGLDSLDVSSFNTSKATNMKYMFKNLNNLEELDVSSFDTSNVTNFYYFLYETAASAHYHDDLHLIIGEKFTFGESLDSSTKNTYMFTTPVKSLTINGVTYGPNIRANTKFGELESGTFIFNLPAGTKITKGGEEFTVVGGTIKVDTSGNFVIGSTALKIVDSNGATVLEVKSNGDAVITLEDGSKMEITGDNKSKVRVNVADMSKIKPVANTTITIKDDQDKTTSKIETEENTDEYAEEGAVKSTVTKFDGTGQAEGTVTITTDNDKEQLFVDSKEPEKTTIPPSSTIEIVDKEENKTIIEVSDRDKNGNTTIDIEKQSPTGDITESFSFDQDPEEAFDVTEVKTDNFACKMDGTFLNSLKTAIDTAYDRASIELTKDYVEDEQIIISKAITFTINTAGHSFRSQNIVVGQGYYMSTTRKDANTTEYKVIKPACYIGAVGYKKLQEAVNIIGKNGTIKLAANNSESFEISKEFSFKIDKNGYTLTPSNIKGGEEYYAGATTEDNIVTVTVIKPTCYIGNVGYKKLKDALDNVLDEETIKLVADSNERVSVSKVITFNLDKSGFTFNNNNIRAARWYAVDISVSDDANIITYVFTESDEDNWYYEPAPEEKPLKTPAVSKVKAGKKKITLVLGKIALSKADGYQIRYSTNKNMKNAKTKKVKNKNKKTTVTIKKLKSKKTYYIQARTYKKGKTPSKWSKKFKVKVK